MISEEKTANAWWSFDLAHYGASPGVVAACCGRTHKWAKHLVEAAGGEVAKKKIVNRTQSFEQGPERKAHVHVVVQANYALRHEQEIGAPERLVRVYRAYRRVVGQVILTVDEVHELLYNVLGERGAESWPCTSCDVTRYVVGANWSRCPGCELKELLVCVACDGAIHREKVTRGRKTRKCYKCRARRGRGRIRRAGTAGGAAGPRQLRLVGLTSPGDTAPPTDPARRTASRSDR